MLWSLEFLGNPAGKPRNFFLQKRKTPFPFGKGGIKKNKNLSNKNTEGGPRPTEAKILFCKLFFKCWSERSERKKSLCCWKSIVFIDKFLWINTNFWAFSVADCVVYAKVVKVIFTQIVSLFFTKWKYI